MTDRSSLLVRLGDWVTDGDTWFGPRGLVALGREHLAVTVVAFVVAALLALGPAVWLAHRRRARLFAAAVAGTGRSIPTLGVIVLCAMVFLRSGRSADFWPLVIALVVLAVPFVFTTAYAAVATVDRTTVEAGVGLGYTDREVLWHIEIPLALPVILDGLRLALVQIVATVALGAVVGSGGGLGQLIVRGFATYRSGGDVVLVGGAVAVTALTVLSDWIAAAASHWVLPVGVRRLRR